MITMADETIFEQIVQDEESKSIIREFQEKDISPHTIPEIKRTMEQFYVSQMRHAINDFMQKMEEYKDYEPFREVFKEFASEELKKMDKSDYVNHQRISMAILTKNQHIERIYRLMKRDKDIYTSFMLLVEVLWHTNKKLLEFVEQWSEAKPQKIMRGLGAVELAFKSMKYLYDKNGSVPSNREIITEANNRLPPGRTPFESQGLSKYLNSGAETMVRRGQITPEEVMKMGFQGSKNHKGKWVFTKIRLQASGGSENPDREELENDSEHPLTENTPEERKI